VKVERMSASRDAVWILSLTSNLPYKFDPSLNQFTPKGSKKAWQISAGMGTHAVIRAKDKTLHGWDES